MPTLPAASSFTGSAITEAQFKSAITDLRTFLADLLGTAGSQAAALAALGALGGTVAEKTGAYTVIAADRGRLIDATSGTWTLSLTAAATLGAGFAFAVRNSGAGTITIDGASTEQIDGATTIALAPGESCVVVCNGTAWKTVGRTVIPEFGVLLGIYSRTTAGSGLTATRPAGATRALIKVQGGGGGGSGGGGGGAGAYAEAWKTVTGDLTVTVGGGSHGGSVNGSASSVAGAGFTTITAAGGGGVIGGAAPTTGDINVAGQSGLSSDQGGDSFLGGGAGATSAAFLGGGGGGTPFGAPGAVFIYWYK